MVSPDFRQPLGSRHYGDGHHRDGSGGERGGNVNLDCPECPDCPGCAWCPGYPGYPGYPGLRPGVGGLVGTRGGTLSPVWDAKGRTWATLCLSGRGLAPGCVLQRQMCAKRASNERETGCYVAPNERERGFLERQTCDEEGVSVVPAMAQEGVLLAFRCVLVAPGCVLVCRPSAEEGVS